MRKFAVAAFAREMLTVPDNLHRALASVPAEARRADAALENLMVGIELTESQMMAAFERIGIRRVEALGQRFDPHLHEAMLEVEDKSRPAGTVVQVLEAGYTLNDRLLRPAKVAVGRGGPPAPPRAANDAGRPPEGKEPPPGGTRARPWARPRARPGPTTSRPTPPAPSSTRSSDGARRRHDASAFRILQFAAISASTRSMRRRSAIRRRMSWMWATVIALASSQVRRSPSATRRRSRA